MANVEIGQCKCPLCKSPITQTVKVSEKSGKPYLNCDECGMQLFARQPASVKLLRDLAQASTAQASTAQASTAQASTAQASTARRSSFATLLDVMGGDK